MKSQKFPGQVYSDWVLTSAQLLAIIFNLSSNSWLDLPIIGATNLHSFDKEDANIILTRSYVFCIKMSAMNSFPSWTLTFISCWNKVIIFDNDIELTQSILLHYIVTLVWLLVNQLHLFDISTHVSCTYHPMLLHRNKNTRRESVADSSRKDIRPVTLGKVGGCKNICLIIIYSDC